MLAALKRLRRSEDKQEATAILPDAKEVSTGTAEVDVLSELEGIFALKEGPRIAVKAFVGGKKCSLINPDSIGES